MTRRALALALDHINPVFGGGVAQVYLAACLYLGYEDEFRRRFRHFQSVLALQREQPSADSKEMVANVSFISHVSPCYKTVAAELPAQLAGLLDEQLDALDPNLRNARPNRPNLNTAPATLQMQQKICTGLTHKCATIYTKNVCLINTTHTRAHTYLHTSVHDDRVCSAFQSIFPNLLPQY